MSGQQLYVHTQDNPELQRHNYFQKLQVLIAAGVTGKVGVLSQTRIYHDDWCAIFRGGYCNCDPDIEVMDEIQPQSAG